MTPIVTADGGFSPSELERLLALCAALPLTPGATHDGGRTRTSDIAFLDKADAHAWVFERLDALVTVANQHFQLALDTYEVQYAEYPAARAGHYDWHIDLPLAEMTPTERKLSMTLFLNTDFAGGEFQVNFGNPNEPYTPPLAAGRALFFPSFLQHRVLPVTRGVRKSLVLWVTGPRFV